MTERFYRHIAPTELYEPTGNRFYRHAAPIELVVVLLRQATDMSLLWSYWGVRLSFL